MHRIFSDELLHCRRKPVQVDILFLDLPVDSRSIRKHFHDLLTRCYKIIPVSGYSFAHLNEPLFDLVFIQMRRAAFLTVLELVVALPDDLPVGVVAVPDLRPVPAAAIPHLTMLEKMLTELLRFRPFLRVAIRVCTMHWRRTAGSPAMSL